MNIVAAPSAGSLQFSSLPPLALYIHFPWCVRKCPYCDFNSHEAKQAIPESEYIDALIRDLEQDLPRIWGRSVDSIFMGGGTPSLFSAAALDRLLSALRARLVLKPTAEVTLEANPGTVETTKFKEYRALGVNRLSIGMQSFNERHLQMLGRIHSAHEAIFAAEAAHEAGFDNFNIDLMFGLPQQQISEAEADVAQAIALQPTHISYYQLTLEPNTAFHHQPPPLPDDDRRWEMHQHGQEKLAAAGYAQYEVSAYAQKNRQCWHNLNYWRFGDYLGIGAGAHGKITDAPQQRIVRTFKQKHPKRYLGEPHAMCEETALGPDDAASEFMLNALRLREGFETRLFSERTGLPLTHIEDALREAERRGLLEWNVERIRPTDRGYLFLNDLLMLFLS